MLPSNQINIPGLNQCNQVMLPVMILTGRLISYCLKYQTLPTFANKFLTFLGHLNLPLLRPHGVYRTKPEFSICEALQWWRSTEPHEAHYLWKHSKVYLLCCQCSGVHTGGKWTWVTGQHWELNQWLSQFVLEIRWHHGKEHPPNSLYQHYIQKLKAQLDVLRAAAFASCHQTLDTEMKPLKAGGLEVSTKQAKPITSDADVAGLD